MSTTEKKRRMYLDVAKFMAIFAVMIDHTNGILYQNSNIALFSYYSVSLFILVMGITTYLSFSRSKDIGISIIKKCWNIFRPYLVGTFIYGVLYTHTFDLSMYLNHVVHFDMVGPFYYVLLYIQLVIVSPLLYYSLQISKKKGGYGFILDLLVLVIVLVIASFTTINTNLLGIYGGGGRLLGGSYLILLYIGMLFGKYFQKIKLNKWVNAILMVISSIALITWYHLIRTNQWYIDSMVPLGSGFNPPSISFMVYALIWIVLLFILENFLECIHVRGLTKLFDLVGFLGRHTLYIFIYHRLFIDFFIPKLIVAIGGQEVLNIWLLRIGYFIIMIGGSLLFEFVLEKFHMYVLHAYGRGKNLAKNSQSAESH